MKKKKIFITAVDLIIVSICILLSIIGLSYAYLNKVETGELIITSPSGTFSYTMDKHKLVEIEGRSGITTIEIEKNKFRFIDSPCKNKLCTQFGYSSSAYIPIICLPNGVSARIVNKKQINEIDGITM